MSRYKNYSPESDLLTGLHCMLQKDKDPILRWSAMYTVAMAYAGTGNNQAIRRLLHVAVSPLLHPIFPISD